MRTDMKTKTYIITLLLAIAAASACTREKLDPAAETASATVENGSQVLVPFTAEAGEPQTRVAMDGSTNNIVFSAGDQLLVYCWKIVEPSILTLQSGAGNKSAVFSGELILAEGKTEADLAGKTLNASLIPQEGVSQGIFSYDPSGKRLTVDYSANTIDSDLEALFRRTAIYQGTTKYEDRRFEFRLLTSYIKMKVDVPSEKSSLARDYTVEVTSDYHIPTTATNSGLGWGGSGEYATISGTFHASYSSRGTAYMAVLADSSMRVEDDGVMYDEVTFQITMHNVYKEYDLVGGVIDKQIIEPGKGYIRSITQNDLDNEDVLKGQPESVRNRFLQSESSYYADLNGNGSLSKYEAAQVSGAIFKDLEDLTDATCFQYFTALGASQNVFENCSKLFRVSFPSHLTVIGPHTFDGCRALKTINLPSRITALHSGAFANSGLTRIDLSGTHITKIGISAFSGSSHLATVVLPESLEEIASDAFSYCYAVEDVYCYATTPPTVIDKNVPLFVSSKQLAHIYVPAASVAAYKTAYKWSDYADKITAMP